MFYYEQMLNTALSGIMTAGLMSTILTVAYGILLASLLFSAYEAWTKGGDVRALGVAGIKYLALGALFMNSGVVYERVFRDILAAFNQISHTMAGVGPTDVFKSWANDIYVHGSLSTTFLNLVAGHIPRATQRTPSAYRDDRVSGCLRVVRRVLFPLRHHPVRDRSACTGPNAELWTRWVGQALRNQRDDLWGMGLDLRHLLPLGDRNQRPQHGRAHIREQLCGRAGWCISRDSLGRCEHTVLRLHFAHSAAGETDR